MNDLFKKLNVLVKASVNELLDSSGTPRRRALTPEVAGKQVEHDIKMLRERVDDALAYEGELAARVQTMQAEVDRLDQRADAAVASGQPDTARIAVEQLQRLQQRLAMAESDLREHRIVTQELISRVNQLEAVVAEARENQPEAQPDEAADTLERAGQAVSDVLHEMREKIAELSEMIGTPGSATQSDENPLADAPPTADEQAVEDDLARRRERLSKK